MLPRVTGSASPAAATPANETSDEVSTTSVATEALNSQMQGGTKSPTTRGSEPAVSISTERESCNIPLAWRGKRQRHGQRRRRRSTQGQNELFTTFTLNRDPENSKYLPYDEVVYPRLFNRPVEVRQRVSPYGTVRVPPLIPAAELNSMWIVGFVENARRRQRNLLVRELRDFVCLPGSEVLPGAHAALVTLSQLGRSTSFNSMSSPRSISNDSRSLARLEGDSRQDGRPGDTYYKNGAERHRCSAPGHRISGNASVLTPLEKLRLRELEQRLTLKDSRPVNDAESRLRTVMAPYGAANRKLRKILRGAKPPAIAPAIKSHNLEAVFRRNRDELAAVVRIQRVYKRYFRRKRFGQLFRQLRGVVRVQALARGLLARRFVAEWYARRSAMVLGWQTVIRRMLSNIRWKRRLEAENKAATKMQAVVLGHAGRKKARHRRSSAAALRIQRLWRGCVDRGKADRLWLDIRATRIQGLARVTVARKVVERKRRICDAAATVIQRCFRGMVARGVLKRLIWERSMERRVDFLRALASEEEWERENMELMQRRSGRMRLEERLAEALSAEAAAHDAVFKLQVTWKKQDSSRGA